MKDKITANWFKLAILAILLVLGLSVILMVNNKIVDESEKNSQIKCADMAASYFKDIYGYSKYTNHWNMRLKKCFIYMQWEFVLQDGPVGKSGQWSSEWRWRLYDVFEKKLYGELDLVLSNPNNELERINSCNMYINGDEQDKNKCDSEAEFRKYVSSLMND